MADKWYVHYLVGSGFVPAQKCVAGPYTEAEASEAFTFDKDKP